jgi:hypothetical protein
MSYPILFGNMSSQGGEFVFTGGTAVTTGGYKYHIFSSIGSTSFTVLGGPKTLDYLVVGGGGGTGTNRAGGGGAGGLLQSTFSVTEGTYNTFVGNKGIKGVADVPRRQSSGGFSGIGSSSSGYRYWKFVGGAGPYGSHFPNSSRIGFTTESGDVDFVVYNGDNCSDTGKIPGLSSPTDTYVYDFGAPKTVTGIYLYSVYNGGYRIGSAQIYGSSDNSNWTLVDAVPIDNANICGLLRFNVSAPPTNLLVKSIGGGASGASHITFGSGGGADQGSSIGIGTAGQGNNGGNSGGTGSGGSGAGGGGGGYSAAGQSAPGATTAGSGGQGWSITSGWSSLSVFSGMSVLSSGGGGAAPWAGSGGAGGTGAGNGGYGTSSNSVGSGTNATSFGSGGGGGAYGGGYSGGTGSDGYQGLVIVRYAI